MRVKANRYFFITLRKVSHARTHTQPDLNMQQRCDGGELAPGHPQHRVRRRAIYVHKRERADLNVFESPKVCSPAMLLCSAAATAEPTLTKFIHMDVK